MRRRLTVLVAVTTSAVVLAFLVPLLLLLRVLAEDRALAAASSEARGLVSAITLHVQDEQLKAYVADLQRRSVDEVTLMVPNGTVIGVAPPRSAQANLDRARRAAFTAHEGGSQVLYLPTSTAEGLYLVRIAVPGPALHAGVLRASAIISALGAGLLLLACAVAFVVGTRVSAPVRHLAVVADTMREGHLQVRAPERGTSETVALARALNRLAARVVELLATERDAVADLSHRLRTPVTALRLDTDGVRDPVVAQRLREHVAHLERTVDAIVHDARRPIRSDVDLACDARAVVAERVAFWSALAEDQGRLLGADLPAGALNVPVDRAELMAVVDVLLDNVFAHTPDGTSARVRLRRRPGGDVELVVEDAGPGLPDHDVVGRGRSTAGSTGLGLDIVRRAALASGGHLELDRSPLGGARVSVLLGRGGRRFE